MFWFFAIVTIIGIVALGVSLICLATGADPLGLWITISAISLTLVAIGGFGGSLYQDTEEENTITQEEYIEDEYQYNYYPYCGKEIK